MKATLNLKTEQQSVTLDNVRAPGWWVSTDGRIAIFVSHSTTSLRMWFYVGTNATTHGWSISNTASGKSDRGRGEARFRQLDEGESITFTN